MTIRDINDLSKIIQEKIDLGLQLDSSILDKFQKNTQNKNFIFSNGIDFIHEFFKFNKKTGGNNLNIILKLIGKNKSFMNAAIKFADKGLNI